VSNTLAINIENITKLFKGALWFSKGSLVLKEINLNVPKGSIFVLLGPNGAGKTTLIKIMLGIIAPTSGCVSFFGEGINSTYTKNKVSYLPENTSLYEDLTVLESLELFCILYNISDKKTRTEYLLNELDLTKEKEKKVKHLSKGNKKKLEIAQALINDPDILILDEPTNALDPIISHKIKQLFIKLREKGKTIFITTHLLNDIEEICDRVAIIKEGQIISQGSKEELLTQEKGVNIVINEKINIEKNELLAQISKSLNASESNIEVKAIQQSLQHFFNDKILNTEEQQVIKKQTEAERSEETQTLPVSNSSSKDQLIKQLIEKR
jgi:ABC-2 type transport system ATP-binding protein